MGLQVEELGKWREHSKITRVHKVEARVHLQDWVILVLHVVVDQHQVARLATTLQIHDTLSSIDHYSPNSIYLLLAYFDEKYFNLIKMETTNKQLLNIK